MLKKLGLKRFKAVESHYRETFKRGLRPENQAINLSLGKARAVASREKNALVIAADTIVYLAGKPLGKPKSRLAAKRMLNRLSGRDHMVVTGFAIIDAKTGKTLCKAEKTKVFFKALSEEAVENYIATDEPMDKAGAYAIQGKAATFVRKIEGDYDNVVGLPTVSLAKELSRFGITIKKRRTS